MMASGSGSTIQVSDRDFERVEGEVRQAALDHLAARDAATALSDFTEDAVLVSNARWYTASEWADLIEEFYGTMQRVHVAEWEDMRVDVLSIDAAVCTARFRWGSTDTSGVTTSLEGVWTALYVREAEGWKIRVRHESFESAEG